jgi:Fur family ferric uptake transcriptional regulator
MDSYQELLYRVRQQGWRITRQRATILQALCELDGHASAEQVYERVTLHHSDIDLSTIYRTLEGLRDLRVISQTDLGRGCAEYEIVAKQPHHHLICKDCNRVVDLDHKYLIPVAQAIERDFGFEATIDHFAIYGLCHHCHSKDRDRLVS